MSINDRHFPYAAFRHRDFRLIVVASVASTVGAEMQSVAVGWELYRRTHQALPLGIVGLVQALPVVLLALPAGVVAERVSRRSIILATQATMVAASLGLSLSSYFQAPIWAMYACLGLAGVASAFAFPARWALLPQLVPAEDFHGAVAWRTSAWQVAAATGPALGGFVLSERYGGLRAYLADAALGLVALGAISLIRPRPPAGRGAPLSMGDMLAGVRFVGSRPLIVASITLDMFAVLLGGATALLPIYGEILRVGPVGYGWLRAAPALGAVSTAVVLAHRPPIRRAGRALLWSVAGFGVATIVFGLSTSYPLSLAMLLLTGALDNISVVIRSTLVQLLTPDSLRGRVSAVNSIFIGISNELGAFESGGLAALVGPVAAVVAGGVGCLGVVLGVNAIWPQVRQLGPLATVGVDEAAFEEVIA